MIFLTLSVQDVYRRVNMKIRICAPYQDTALPNAAWMPHVDPGDTVYLENVGLLE